MTPAPTPLTPEEIKASTGPWECFQCGVVCETEDEALDHFGRDSSVPPMCIRAGAYPDGIMGVVRHLQDEVDRWRTEAWGDGRLSASLLYEQVTRADLKTYFGVETAHQAYLRANDDAFAKHVKDAEINRLESDRAKAIAERDALRAENAALRDNICRLFVDAEEIKALALPPTYTKTSGVTSRTVSLEDLIANRADDALPFGHQPSKTAATAFETADTAIMLYGLLDKAKATALSAIAERDRLRAENAALREALTPSGGTRAAYIGEFQFDFPIGYDDGADLVATPNVPWTTIKAIMAAILVRADRALLKERTDHD